MVKWFKKQDEGAEEETYTMIPCTDVEILQIGRGRFFKMRKGGKMWAARMFFSMMCWLIVAFVGQSLPTPIYWTLIIAASLPIGFFYWRYSKNSGEYAKLFYKVQKGELDPSELDVED